MAIARELMLKTTASKGLPPELIQEFFGQLMKRLQTLSLHFEPVAELSASTRGCASGGMVTPWPLMMASALTLVP